MEKNRGNLPHIGKILRNYVEENRLSQAAWARSQGIKQTTVISYFKKPTMQIDTLFTISKILNYNFFRQVADSLPSDMAPHKPNPLQEEMDLLKKENERLKNQIDLLKEVLGMKIKQ